MEKHRQRSHDSDLLLLSQHSQPAMLQNISKQLCTCLLEPLRFLLLPLPQAQRGRLFPHICASRLF